MTTCARGIGLFLLAAVLQPCVSAADAQQATSSGSPASSGALAEVVVTATKRAEPIQSVPMSITAFTARDIERNDFISIQDWGNRLPNLAFQADDQSRTDLQTSVEIRGVSGAGTTGFYIDDSPLPASLDPRVFDLERIEVLRGPQGTLYGARSMGGTVRFITQQPNLQTFEGNADGQISSTEHGSTNDLLSGIVNLPLVEGVAAVRLLGYSEYDSGWLDRAPLPDSPVQYPVDRGFNSDSYIGGQINGLISLDDGNLTISPRVLYQENNRGGRSEADYQASDLVNYRLFDLNETGGSHWTLSTLTIRYERPFGSFVSATSYFKQLAADSEDGSEVVDLTFGLTTPTPAFLTATDNDHTFSQEFRFTSDFAGPLRFTAGLFYQDTSTLTIFPPAPMPPVTDDLFQMYNPTDVKEAAVYGQATLALTRHLSVIAGGRYFHNKVSFLSLTGGLFGDDTPYSSQQKQSGVTPKYGLQYQFDKDHMVYADAAKGYRIGGGNTFSSEACASGLDEIGISADAAKTFNSDFLWSYEVGAKTAWLDHRLSLDTAAFLIDWTNLQQVLGLGSCGYEATINIGAARSKGGELEMDWEALQGLELSLGGGYTDAYITSDGGLGGIAAAVGSPVQNVPKWTVNSAVDYDRKIAGVSSFWHADYAYVGSSYDDRNAPRIRPSHALVNLRAGVDLDGWQLALFVKNLTDQAADLGDVPPMVIQYPGRPRIAINTPRTVGIDARVNF